jgi:hypothetical protein
MKGTVIICPDLPVCPPNVTQTQMFLFEPWYPTVLGEVDASFETDIFCAGMSWNWRGRLLVAGGFRLGTMFPCETYLFDPLMIDASYTVNPPGGIRVYGYNGATPLPSVDSMSTDRYYPSLVPLSRQPIVSSGVLDCCFNVDMCECIGPPDPAPTISGAGHLVLGGPHHPPSANDGNELWQVFDSTTEKWSHTLRTDDPLTIDPSLINMGNPEDVEKYFEKKLPAAPPQDEVYELLDSYPRAFQLGGPEPGVELRVKGQVFVANDVDTNAFPHAVAPSPPAKSWVIKPPAATATNTWELWHGVDEPPHSDCATTAEDCFTDRFYGTAVLLHTLDHKNRVLVFGGSQDREDYPNTNQTVWTVNSSVREYEPRVTDGSIVEGGWHEKAPLAIPRVHLNSVILPTGKILIVGGDQVDHDHDTEPPTVLAPNPVLQPELYDPGPLPTSQVASIPLPAPTPVPPFTFGNPRRYHSLAVLLADGSVLVAGGEEVPPGAGYPDSRYSGEVFKPAYMTATRPVITAAPGAVCLTGDPFNPVDFEIEVDTDSYPDIKRVVLLRPAALTHHCDMDQRYIELVKNELPSPDGMTYTVESPHESLAPPGYYMMFVVAEVGGALIPSEAHFIRIKKR